MKTVIYTRKSTEQDEKQALSLESQLRELRQFTAEEQLQIVASFQEAKTAKEPGRKTFREMLEFIEQGEADGILAWHPDRLARNAVDGGAIIHLLDTGKLQHLYFPTMSFENTPQGKFMLSIAFGQSKLYVDNLSENVRRGQRQKVHRGEWTWPAPLGYRNNRETRNIEPDPERASLVRKAFELFATGEYTFTALHKELKKLGLRSPKGNVVSLSNIQRMLQYPVYYGFIHLNGEFFPGSFEPLISKKLFNKVQEVIKDKSRPTRQKKHNFPFTGFLKCASCGCSITAEMQKGHHYYRCSKKRGPCEQKKYMREETLLEKVKAIVERVSLPADWCDNMLDYLDKEETKAQRNPKDSVQTLKDEQLQIDNKIDDLLDLRLEGVIDSQEYVTKKNKLVNQRIDLEQQIKNAGKNILHWVEPMREMILASRQAKKLQTTKNLTEIPTFLKSVGSNFRLRGGAVLCEGKTGWRVLLNNRDFSSWWVGRDSNPRPIG
jgi:site-specific DNA recombinase